MPILANLTGIYQNRGISIAAGLNPSHFGNFALAPYTWFLKDGKSLTNGLGIALQEIYFLECLFARFRPERLFVIGNSLGWSSLTLGLLNPQGRVLAIDAGLDRNAVWGLDFTNAAAREHGMRLTAARGMSPDDVPRLLAEHAMTPVDFAFIDGYHSVEQVQRDFRAIWAQAAAGCVYLFHDVHEHGLAAGIERIVAETGYVSDLLLGTTSGMALVYDPALRPAALDDVAPFIAPPDAVALIARTAWEYRHPHRARWRRSLAKRLHRRESEGSAPPAPADRKTP